jgi:oligopeptide transport system substrate-binding protein
MLEFLRSDNPNNDGKYNNPRFDELVNNSLYESDPDKRMSNFKEAEELLIAKDFALAPYFYADVQSYAHKYLNNISYPLFTGRINFRDAFISGKN